MEQVYARRAIEMGTADLLVQRAIRGRGHCEFAAAEVITAFDDLVSWVLRGIKPEGDDILDPATVAAPDFGWQVHAGDARARAGLPLDRQGRGLTPTLRFSASGARASPTRARASA